MNLTANAKPKKTGESKTNNMSATKKSNTLLKNKLTCFFFSISQEAPGEKSREEYYSNFIFPVVFSALRGILQLNEIFFGSFLQFPDRGPVEPVGLIKPDGSGVFLQRP